MTSQTTVLKRDLYFVGDHEILQLPSHLVQYVWWLIGGLFDRFSASLANSRTSDTFRSNRLMNKCPLAQLVSDVFI